jgi:hypothetical protein
VQTPFFECEQFEFHIIAPQPQVFVEGFSEADKAKLQVACEGIAHAYAEGSPQVRSRLVRGAKMHDLFAIFVDWPQTPGWKKVLLARRDRNRVLVARGLKTSDGEIPAREVARAEAALAKGVDGDPEEGGG